MKIRETSLRIRLAGLAILALLIALAAVAYFSGRQVQRNSELIATDAVPGMIDAHDMRMAMSRSVGYMMVAASAQTTQSRDASIKIAHDADAAFTNTVNQYAATIRINPAEDQALIGRVTGQFAEFYRQRMTYEALILAGDRNGSADFLETNLVPAYVSATQSAQELLKYNNSNSITYANSIRNSVHRLYWTVAIVMALALVCAAVLVVNFAIRRREVAELRASEARFRMLIENAPTAINISRDGKSLYSNQKFLDFYGYQTGEELSGRSVLIFWAQEFQEIIKERVQKRAQGEQVPSDYEGMAQRKDGSRFPVQVAVASVELPDGPASLAFINDITERKKAEKSLRESDERYKSIIQVSNTGAWEYHSDSGYLWCSPEYFSMLGRSQSDYNLSGNKNLQETWVDLLHPDDRKPAADHFAEYLKNGSIGTYESYFRMQHRDGSWVWIWSRGQTLRDAQGNVTNLTVGTHIDITERKRAEESLKLFRMLIDHANDAIEVIDPQTGRFLDVNEKAGKVHGYTREEYLALTIPEIDPEFATAGEKAWKAHLENLQRFGFMVFETQHRRKDGSVFPVEINASYVRLERDYILAVVRDITEQKRAQEEMRATNRRYHRQEEALMRLTQSVALRQSLIPEMKREVTRIAAETLEVERVSIWRYERDNQGIVCQELFERNKCSHSAGTVLLAENFPAYFRALADGNVIVAHDAQRDPRTTEFSENYLRPRGISSLLDAPIHVVGSMTGVVCCEHVGPPRQWTTDEQTFAIAIANLVSLLLAEEERQQIEGQFRQSQKMEAVGQLASGVAHDFNNILGIIQMQSDLLKADGTLSPAQTGYAAEIGEAIGRAAALTRQLLLFGRKEKMQAHELDLNQSINDMTKMLRRTLGENIQLQFKFSMQPLFVNADAGMMDQVLMNLSVNARDAMPQGGKIVIEASAVIFDESIKDQYVQARAGSFVCLSVSDTGSGIPPEILPKIFEPFFTTKDVGKGTGLGLATVFGIVQQHKGWINVYSETGQGTTFRIYIPRLAKISDQKFVAPLTEPARGGNETILVAEDEPKLRASVFNMLSRLGYNVLEASDGASALEVWNKHRDGIHLLLTDMVMPGGMTGKDLGERLLKENPKLKVIYASGYSTEVAARDFPLEEGVNFLSKPFQAQKLARIVRERLDAKI